MIKKTKSTHDLYDHLARLSALAQLAALSLPVSSPEQMERESVSPVEPLP